MKRLLCILFLAFFVAACGETAPAPTTTTGSTPTAQATQAPTATPTQVTWHPGAIQIFHGTSNYQGIGGYTDPFTVPALWRLAWFCQPASDPTQAFFAIDVQHAGDLSNADGETPLQVD